MTLPANFDEKRELQNRSVVDALDFATLCARAYNSGDLVPREEALATKPDPTPSEDVEEALDYFADKTENLCDCTRRFNNRNEAHYSTKPECETLTALRHIATLRRALSQPSREALLVLASAVFDGVERFNFCSFCEHRTDDKCDTAQVRETCTSAVVAWAVGQAALTQATTPTSEEE